MASLQMNALGWNNGVFLPAPAPARWYWNSSKPLSCNSFSSFVVRKRWDFDVRNARFRVAGALANGELEAGPSAMEFLGKELKFSPTFDDYVKVMESVRTDRSNGGSGGVDGYRPGRRPAKRYGKVKDSKVSERKKNDGNGGRSSGGWGLVEGILEKRSMKRNDDDFRERRNSQLGCGTELVNKSHFEDRKNCRDVKFNKVERGGNSFDSRGVETDGKFGVEYLNNESGRRVQLENTTNSVQGKVSKGKKVMRKSEELVAIPNDTVNGYATEAEKIVSKAAGVSPRSGKDGPRSRMLARRSINDDDFEDRAAFKTFEVFTDVNNRPRVLRMELEEKIEKLAKWLNATNVNMPEWQFSKMIHSAKIKFTDHSILRLVQILGTLGNWKRVLQVVEWLQSHERFKSYKSRYIYTSVLDVLGKARRPIEALNVYNIMRQELSSYPDLAAYRCIAVTLGQAGLMKELFDVIDCMRTLPKKKFNLGPLQKWDPRLEPDLVIYNAQKQWEGAFWVLQQLKIQHLKPSNTTYGLVMEVMLACGKYNLVHEFFRKVEKNSIPSALNYKVLVNTLWREGKIDEAVLAVQDMENRGIVGTASLYYDLARCLCSAGRCDEALLQIDKICKVAKKPLVVTYTGLIQACLDSGNMETGTYIFKQMQKFCSPNTVTYNIMLKSYIEHGMLEEAKALFKKMLDSSHQISSKADSRLAAVPDKFTFNTMIEAFAEAKHWDDFANTYMQMLHHGFYFDKKRHLRLVLDAFREGKTQVLEITWDHLVHSGRVPPPPIIKERFCMKLHDGEFTAAISCIETHPVTEINNSFSQKSWLSLLQINANRIKKNTVIRLEHEVNNFLATTNQPHPVHQNLLNACQEFLSSATYVEHQTISHTPQSQTYIA
ncbi:TPR-like protein [Dioscorea alata]|uniref:TPR-like protein n=1 Tax=Dioscorea alata TaxID=55571 RepID=A0ACB7U2C6_DIOAL|nr:TPR-like protein [Dioscorea alata]